MIVHNTSEDETFNEEVNIVKKNKVVVVEKLLQLQDLKLQLEASSNHYVIFNKINSLINELGEVLFEKPFMIMKELKDEKNEKKGLKTITNYFNKSFNKPK
jgi:hypothetical protein